MRRDPARPPHTDDVPREVGEREGAGPGAAPRYNCETRRDGDRATIRVRWFVLVDAIGLALTALPFNALWLGQGFGSILTGDREWLLEGFALLFIAIGVGAAYATLAHLLNTTTLSIDRERVRVRHGPVPLAGRRSASEEGHRGDRGEAQGPAVG